MCGINGIYSFSGPPLADADDLIASMNQCIQHRGPDDMGVWDKHSAGIWLGHQRLSIVDLTSNGHQPMELGNGMAITYNGEIYNYRELIAQVPEHRFRSSSDTELLLALYAQRGESCLDDLVGMFAFGIWDSVRQSLFLARDRIGKKPLYYCQQDGHFAFSSELRSLLALPWIQRRIDRKALYNFLTFGFCPPPQTMFEGICKLPPGHCMTVDRSGEFSIRSYWTPSPIALPDDEQGLLERLGGELERSLDLRMVSDVPVGIFLSGGVDSTGLAAMLHQQGYHDVRSFSISFAGQPTYDESSAARATANKYGLTHHERVVTADDMQEMIGTIADVFDEPLADPTCIPIYFLAEMSRKSGTKVILTGDGPDELLLGYRNWQKYLTAYPWFHALERAPGFLSRGVSAVGSAVGYAQMAEMGRRASRHEELFWGNAPSFAESQKTAFLSPAFARESQPWSCHDVIHEIRREYDNLYGSAKSDANWMSFIGLRFVIPNYYLHRADRLGMRHSIELRAPYLDHNFVNCCLSIDAKWKVRGTEGKYILKKMFEPLLPRDLLYAPKKGFCVPIREWGESIMKDYLRQNLTSFCSKNGLFNESRIRAEVEHGSITNVWNLYFLVNWFEKWLP